MRSFSGLARVLLIAGALAAPLGCGGKSRGSGPDVTGAGSAGSRPSRREVYAGASGGNAGANGGSAGGKVGESGDTGAGGALGVECPAGIPSAAELASTPRENVNLELLALKLSDGIVAEQAVYDRVVRDVAAIHKSAPELADITYFSNSDGRELFIAVDSPTYDAMQAGSYDAWSCVNDAYGAQDPTFSSSRSSFDVSLVLRGTYDLDQVAAQYAALPGVKRAEPEYFGGDDSTICLTHDGATWHYVFDQADGDCPLGCTSHKYTHFTTSGAGDVTNLGTPSPAEQAQYASREACQ